MGQKARQDRQDQGDAAVANREGMAGFTGVRDEKGCEVTRQQKRAEIAAAMSGNAPEPIREELARELEDPRSETAGAFAELLLEGAAEVIATEERDAESKEAS